MEPKIIAPTKTTRELKDRNKLFENMKSSDFDEISAIIDKKSVKSIFGGATINTVPSAGSDGWYPTLDEIQDFLSKHKPLTKKDVVFLRWLLTVDENSAFAKNMMTDSQKKAYKLIAELDLGQNK